MPWCLPLVGVPESPVELVPSCSPESACAGLQQYREQLRAILPRAEATLALLDALSNNIDARSVAALSLNPLYHNVFGNQKMALPTFW